MKIQIIKDHGEKERILYNSLVTGFIKVVCHGFPFGLFLSKGEKLSFLAGRETLFIFDMICVHEGRSDGHDPRNYTCRFVVTAMIIGA